MVLVGLGSPYFVERLTGVRRSLALLGNKELACYSLVQSNGSSPQQNKKSVKDKSFESHGFNSTVMVGQYI